jgi:hypothetical protein
VTFRFQESYSFQHVTYASSKYRCQQVQKKAGLESAQRANVTTFGTVTSRCLEYCDLQVFVNRNSVLGIQFAVQLSAELGRDVLKLAVLESVAAPGFLAPGGKCHICRPLGWNRRAEGAILAPLPLAPGGNCPLTPLAPPLPRPSLCETTHCRSLTPAAVAADLPLGVQLWRQVPASVTVKHWLFHVRR